MVIPLISTEDLKALIEQREKELNALKALRDAAPLLAEMSGGNGPLSSSRNDIDGASDGPRGSRGDKQLEVLRALSTATSLTVRQIIPLIGPDAIKGDDEVEKAKILSKRMQALMRKELIEPDPNYNTNKYDYRWRITSKGRKALEGQ